MPVPARRSSWLLLAGGVAVALLGLGLGGLGGWIGSRLYSVVAGPLVVIGGILIAGGRRSDARRGGKPARRPPAAGGDG